MTQTQAPGQLPMKKLVLGGCRSGKSRYAEQWVGENFSDKVFVATLESRDDAEMEQRIALHRQSRGGGWLTLEEPLDLVGVLAKNEIGTEVFLVDCLTMWLTNMMMQDWSDEKIEGEVARLSESVAALSVSVVLVANEVGLGIVPESPLGRRFRDLAGWTNQQMAGVCRQVVLVTAGLPLRLKG
ncbi:bifunctional adenosylcobinamide kinase/adenosylcobinamide-phosphate guanylyltransferase [Thiovibrio frasassiensis]|uniref:Adenosylcobinamide kinase n=1 Tax=Thiovibrio frasassiensis TaxID=2984131 RepID=A0A9X4MI15_9BACT|nr:bifunctional adenosylcobinamide kinase/adenosylcobinamide-phosphate guanylyltransferase [Thiovibrio frasassiensis]MDG4476245.1 bifunctional adenosylcobinamide kinase/adenosylcobinamide-phosphate guanylyltransferase [Thiovibrio frasassiensis]